MHTDRVGGDTSRDVEIEGSESESGTEEESETDEEEDDHEEDISPAEAGVIDRIEMRNFMCHASFDLDLGPQINFIIGRNGSGKSAVLTGIAVALGARAADTNRGTTIKSLIMDGKSMARVRIIFKNEGRDAFKPQIFGSKIIVERKLQRQGTNSYFIRSDNHRTVSTKKADLDEILHHFNITVDNPLAFLTQDKAREFLTLSTDQAKYDYFMEGSLINEIIENYKQVSSNIVEVQEKLKQAKTHLNSARAKYEESVALYNMFRKSDSLRKELQLVHGKIYWYNVKVIEKKVDHYYKRIDSARKDIEMTDRKIQEITDKNADRLKQKSSLEGKYEQSTETLRKLSEEFQEVRLTYQKIKVGISDIASEIKSSEGEITTLKNDIEKAQAATVKEEQRLSNTSGGSKETMEQKLEGLRREVQELEKERGSVRKAFINFGDHENEDLAKCERLISNTKNSLSILRDKKKMLLEAQKDKYLPWGRHMNSLINRIRNTNGWHHQPIGPLGAYVSVREEYSDWSDLINTAIGKVLDSFLVCDEHDRMLLQNLFKSFKIQKNIITRKFEKFDYEAGIARGHTSFLDILNIANENVLYTLIDSTSIEKNIVTNNSSNLSSLVAEKNVLNVFSLLNSRSGQRSTGDRNNFRIDPIYYRLNEPHKLCAGTSISNEIGATQDSIDADIEKLNLYEKRKRDLKIDAQNRKLELEDTYKTLQKKLRVVNEDIFRLENTINEEGDLTKIDIMKLKISENENQINQKSSIIESLKDDLDAEHKKFLNIKRELDELRSKSQDMDKEKESMKLQLEDIEVEGAALQSEMQHYDVSKLKRLESISTYETKMKLAKERLEGLIRDAEERCPRDQVQIKDEDTDESITLEYEKLQQAVKESEKSIGKSYEDMQQELLSNKESKETCEMRVIDLDRIFRSLSQDLNNRFKYMHTTITKNMNEASLCFERSLALRGFKGELKFNFKQKELTMLVQTKGDEKKRTVDSLSGGEKSFMQIALLLSIWKVMDSKVRGLDEFDVFMDSVNRSISIKLLLNELRQYPKSQSIFITPQDITTVGDLDSKDINIHKMKDPRNRN